MAKRKSRSLTLIAGILVTGFLVSFFLYMWRYDYKIQRPQDSTAFASRTLRGGIRLDLKNESGYAGPVVLVTLSNISPARVRLLDTRRVYPLYNIQLRAKNSAGVFEDVPLLPDAGRRNSPEKEVFDKDQDAIAELVSGAAYTRAIPLSYMYPFKHTPQTYQVTLTYQPQRIAEALGETFEFLDVTRESVTMSTTFEWPEAPKPPTPPTQPKAPAEAGSVPSQPPEQKE